MVPHTSGGRGLLTSVRSVSVSNDYAERANSRTLEMLTVIGRGGGGAQGKAETKKKTKTREKKKKKKY